MKATIDRFEEELAVLEMDGREHVVPRDALPKGAREGDVVELDSLHIDEKATRDATQRLGALRGKGGKKPSAGGGYDL